MKRKDYKKPTMSVIKMRHGIRLLQTSENLQDYHRHNYVEE